MADLSELLLKAHSTRTQFASAQADLPKDVGDVYRIHDAVYAGLANGARPVAWKVGGPSADVEPTIAPILPRRVLASPATVRAADFHVIGVEAEIAFELSNDSWQVRVALELCDVRLSDWKTAPPLMKLADNQGNWGLVVGSAAADWRTIDFTAQPAELWVGGKQLVGTKGGHPYGNPFRLVEWAQRHLASRTAAVRDGDVITTGSWGGLHFAAPGDEIVARFPGLGEAAARIS